MRPYEHHVLLTRAEREDFWHTVECRADGCWVRSPTYQVRGRKLAARRVAYATWRGRFEPGQWVRSICGNKQCVNPIHLVLDERIAKKGLRSLDPDARLPRREEVLDFLARGFPADDLADLYGVDVDLIYSIQLDDE